ncbi:sugar ABC transporter ATP-binding protein [Actinacidiphila oryziradicis]|uniref:sugar ABC transporter ATP-binding protein n=1 Tax=Actinacidiphila oryziradicis TaxID=2571141 RepID=UPI0023EFCF01|nr:sugar ABC transporter ATP-binding protein [Actinacidiphila oryziradicis]MCW2868746.1 sugar transporter ATP-binding protein [Actinacidiphila oryziradicis]
MTAADVAASPAVHLRQVTKAYGPVRVLDVPDLVLRRGEVVALVGENGAGKSTMMGAIAGTVAPTTGTVHVGGEEVAAGHPAAAAAAGVAMVSQEFPLVAQFSVAENLLLGRTPEGTRRGILDRRALHRQAQAALDELGLDISAGQRLDTLSVAQRQLVEIAKAWARRPLVWILDEPTSALGPVEAAMVLDLARRLAEDGGAVIFVGHRMDEVLDVSDRLVVLRNGEIVADLSRDQASEEVLVRAMVGAELAQTEDDLPAVATATVLAARGLAADGLGPLDLDLNAGEIVGVAGLMGSGRSRLLHTLFGAQPRTGGTVTLAGTPFRPRSPAQAIAAGVTLVAEDRKEQSLLPAAPIRWNLTLTALPRLARRGYLRPAAERREAARLLTLANVRCRSAEQPIRDLSGGNQQRAIFGRAMATNPAVLLLDEPTRGVDVGAKSEIYRLITDAASGGCSVLVASSELEELLRICHRIIVMAGGRAVADIARADFTKELIMTWAATTAPTSGNR